MADIKRMHHRTDEAKSGIIYFKLPIDIERVGNQIMNKAENLCRKRKR